MVGVRNARVLIGLRPIQVRRVAGRILTLYLKENYEAQQVWLLGHQVEAAVNIHPDTPCRTHLGAMSLRLSRECVSRVLTFGTSSLSQATHSSSNRGRPVCSISTRGAVRKRAME